MNKYVLMWFAGFMGGLAMGISWTVLAFQRGWIQ